LAEDAAEAPRPDLSGTGALFTPLMVYILRYLSHNFLLVSHHGQKLI
jgi:hypothetical protein